MKSIRLFVGNVWRFTLFLTLRFDGYQAEVGDICAVAECAERWQIVLFHHFIGKNSPPLESVPLSFFLSHPKGARRTP